MISRFTESEYRKSIRSNGPRKFHFQSFLLVLTLIAFCTLASASSSQESLYLNIDTYNPSLGQFDVATLDNSISDLKNSILTGLSYGKSPGFDEDNDGIESADSAIDIVPNLQDPSSNSCVRWEVFSIESASSSVLCHGPQSCCARLNLMPARYDAWDPLYLTLGGFGATQTNIISAQSIEIEEDALTYSPWFSIDAGFSNSADDAGSDLLSRQFIQAKTNNPSLKSIGIVSLQDTNGNTADPPFSSIEMVVSIPDKASTFGLGASSVSGQTAAKDIVASFENLEMASAQLDRLDELVIGTENPLLENQLLSLGIDAQSLITLAHADSIADENSYDGEVVFEASSFDMVLYCPDDSLYSCQRYSPCAQESSECYSYNSTHIIVHVPHFSTIVVGTSSDEIELNISSPDNSTPLLASGGITLNITSNATLQLNYSLDGGDIFSLGNSTNFWAILNGSLPSGTLENGNHSIIFGILNQFGYNHSLTYRFQVNDTSAPSISLNITNGSSLSATHLFLPLQVNSSEFGNISYSLNSAESQSASLLASKTANLTLSVLNGTNILAINATDPNGNRAHALYEFTFTELGSCQDAIKNGAETGIDCGGSCSSCVDFNFTTDRSAYNLSDTAYISVVSRPNSTVNVTVTRLGQVSWRREFSPAFSGFAISETRAIANTSAYGNYSIIAIMRYLNITEQRASAFEVVSPWTSPLTVTINTNATTINENSPVSFSATLANNISAVSYRWDMENDGTIESTQANLTYRFQTNGTFTVNLTVSDSQGNQTDLETIVSRKLYNVTITVRDNSTLSAIQNAIAELNDITINTSSDGKAVFEVPKGDHDALITHPNYHYHSKEINANSNLEYLVNLTQADRLAPIVLGISPLHNATAYNSSLDFIFSVYDTSAVSCTLYTRSESVLWRSEATASLSNPSGQYSLAGSLDFGTHEWKVECRDHDGNTNSSDASLLHLESGGAPNDLSVDLGEEDLKTSEIESKIRETIASLETLGGKESEISNAIQLKKTLERSLLSLERANRDLHSLVWRNLNGSELEKETQAILDRVEDVKKTTLHSFTIVESTEFVGYAPKPSIAHGLSIAINSSNRKFSKKEMRSMLEEHDRLQSLITVTTRASVVDIEYLDSTRAKGTIIHKKLATDQEDFSGMRYLEIIPKEIAKDADDIQFFFEHEVVEQDPVIQIDIEKVKDYAYMVMGSVDLKDTENLASVLIKKDLKPKSQSAITGFAFADSLASGIKETLDVRLIAEIIIIVILAGVYLTYSFGSIEGLKRRLEPRQIKDIRKKIEDTSHEVLSKNYEEASKHYRMIVEAYHALDPKKKLEVSGGVTQLLFQVNTLYIDKLIDEADAVIGKNDRNETSKIYEKIRALYKVIPKDFKSKVHGKCMELHDRLSRPDSSRAKNTAPLNAAPAIPMK